MDLVVLSLPDAAEVLGGKEAHLQKLADERRKYIENCTLRVLAHVKNTMQDCILSGIERMRSNHTAGACFQFEISAYDIWSDLSEYTRNCREGINTLVSVLRDVMSQFNASQDKSKAHYAIRGQDDHNGYAGILIHYVLQDTHQLSLHYKNEEYIREALKTKSSLNIVVGLYIRAIAAGGR